MPTESTNVLPESTGLDLGSASQEWDAFLRNVAISGTFSGLTSVDFQSTNDILNAAQYSGSDMAAKINNAIIALPANGGSVWVPPGTYSNLTATINITKPVQLFSSTKGHTSTRTCELNWIAGVTGISITNGGNGAVVDGFFLSSDATGTQNFDGIDNKGTRVILRNIVISGFGRNGVRTSATSPDNANLWFYENVRAISCYGDGFLWDGADTNAGIGINLESVTNGGTGYTVGSTAFTAQGCQFINLYTESNTGNQVTINNRGTRITNAWFENGGTLLLGVNSSRSFIELNGAANPTTVTDSGTDNYVFYQPGGSPTILNRLNATGGFFSGIFGTPNASGQDLEIRQGVSTARWKFPNADFAFVPNSDNARDIGITGTNRVRSLFTGTSVVVGEAGATSIPLWVERAEVTNNEVDMRFSSNNTASSLSNYAGLKAIVTQADPSALQAKLQFATNAGDSYAQRWEMLAAGHLQAVTDNTLDIGASGANRPRTLYAGTSVVTPAATVGASGTSVTQIRVYSQSLEVTSVSALTSEEQTFTVTGLATSDKVFVNKPSLSAGLVVGNARVSATDTLAITFGNMTALAIDPAAETYTILAIRS